MAIRKKVWDQLAEAALAVRSRAYAPYSGFAVGAAVLVDGDGDGDPPTIVTGCNVENASYGAAICAERAAICRAVAMGHQGFAALAVATAGPEPAAPCGLCLQVLVELCSDDLPVLMVTPGAARCQTRLGRLITRPFRSFAPGRGARPRQR